MQPKKATVKYKDKEVDAEIIGFCSCNGEVVAVACDEYNRIVAVPLRDVTLKENQGGQARARVSKKSKAKTKGN